MNKCLLIGIFFLAVSFSGQAQKMQQKIGANPTLITPSAVLEVESTSQGFLLPRMTTAQRTAIVSPAAGLQVYDTTTNSMWSYNGTVWQTLNATTATGSSGATVAQTVVSPIHSASGKVWMDRNLGASRRAQSVTDFLAYGQLYQWGRGNDGHADIYWTSATTGIPLNGTTTTLSTTDYPDNNLFITNSNSPYDWRASQNDDLWQPTNGINNPCPQGYRVPTSVELTNEVTTYNITDRVTAFASPLKFTVPGYRHNVTGMLSSVGGSNAGYWSTTVSGINVSYRFFGNGSTSSLNSPRSNGFSVRCIKDDARITSIINCSSPTNNGTLISGIAASGVTSVIQYTGGNGNDYAEQSFASFGVTGLTATRTAGTLANGTGTITFTITGTPSASGTANFNISIGQMSCTLERNVFIADRAYGQTINSVNNHNFVYNSVTGADGKTWLNNNLGAHYADVNHVNFNPNQQATSATDHLAYGSLFQWGRSADGHELRSMTGATAGTPVNGLTSAQSASDDPGTNLFITTNASPNDWRAPQNNSLWQGLNGLLNPCPVGYRVPTSAELTTLVTTANITNRASAYSSSLKLTAAGLRLGNTGDLLNLSFDGYYWSSTVASSNANYRMFNSTTTDGSFSTRSNGLSVRCIKN